MLDILTNLGYKIAETVRNVKPGLAGPPISDNYSNNNNGNFILNYNLPIAYVPQDLVNNYVMKYEMLLEAYPIVQELLGNTDFNVSEKASNAIFVYIYLFYMSKRKDDLV